MNIKQILLYIWQLPQHLLGLIFCLLFREEKSLMYKDKKIRVCSRIPGTGVSLGDYIFVRKYPYDNYTWMDVKHEYGHSVDSKIWGWLYLLVIGIPSFIWGRIYKYDPDKPYGYFKFYTERWSDKHGGVVRE